MEGIEISINELSFYHANKAELSNVFTDLLINKELKFKLNKFDCDEINNRLEEKLNSCLSKKDYFKTDRKFFESRVKKITYKEKEYLLNLSESKHYYFFELVCLHNILNSSDDKIVSFKFVVDSSK